MHKEQHLGSYFLHGGLSITGVSHDCCIYVIGWFIGYFKQVLLFPRLEAEAWNCLLWNTNIPTSFLVSFFFSRMLRIVLLRQTQGDNIHRLHGVFLLIRAELSGCGWDLSPRQQHCCLGGKKHTDFKKSHLPLALLTAASSCYDWALLKPRAPPLPQHQSSKTSAKVRLINNNKKQGEKNVIYSRLLMSLPLL